MKKALFNKKLGLLDDVLDGRKVQTRRFCANQTNPNICECKWKVGEIIAVSQSYKDALMDVSMSNEKGWNNSMFVRADLMPHRIRITNIRVERLQDISDEDCLKEGITPIYEAGTDKKVIMWYALNNIDRKSRYETPREAYAALIDKVSGKGTWDSNPYVFAYDFELV